MAKSAPEIKLTISNGSSQAHPEILLRKFFAMVFIDTTGKKLDIFIATIFGGVADNEKKMQDGLPFVNYDKDPTKKCFLNFKFESKILSKSVVEDITDSFCHQTRDIKRVWCDDGDEHGIEEYTDEKAAADGLEMLYPQFYPQGKAVVSLDPNTHSKVYGIRKGNTSTHHCMAVRGSYTPPSEEGKAEYSLSISAKVDGLEAVNWIKTELTLTESILDRRIQFAIEFGPDQIFYTPDFTWYFAPPAESAVKEDTAMLILGHGGKKIPNNIQNVSDDTTVLFNEWEKLDIEGRRKARVQAKQLDQWKAPYTGLSAAKRVAVSFETVNPQKETNRQFMVGLVVAFILAFCSDKTRINDFYECLQRYCQCQAEGGICFCQIFCNCVSIFAPVLVLLTFWVYAYSPKRCFSSSWRERHPRWWCLLRGSQGISLATLGLLAVYIFLLWPVATRRIGGVISCDQNKYIIIVLSFVNVCSSLFHILSMKFRWKRSPKY